MGAPRGASFSWYTYSPLRVEHPYIRRPLLEAWRRARARHGDPVEAWAAVMADREQVVAYKQARGHGGFVRASWDEALELVAAATVDNVREFGPDRVCGFSPIPAMSMASYAGGSRFLSLLGAPSSVSTTGTATCRSPRLRSGASRRMCPRARTGSTAATSSCGAATCP